MTRQLDLVSRFRQAATQTVRRDDQVPAVLYGYGLKNVNLWVDGKQFASVFKEAGYTSLLDLTVKQGKKNVPHKVIIREVQLHPVRDTVLHVDFYQPRLDQAIVADVPLRFVGESTAVKDLGGVLVRVLDQIELEALPVDLPHDIEVDISVLTDFEKVIHVRDLKIAGKVKLNHELSETVALVQPPRTEEELEALSEEVGEDIEGVEGVEDKEQTEEEDKQAEDDSGEPASEQEADDKKET